MRSLRPVGFIVSLALSSLSLASFAAVAAAAEIAPITTGPYAVGSTNFTARADVSGDLFDYLNGKDGWFSSLRYVDQILAHRDAAFIASVQVPGDDADDAFPVVCYVLYPTPADNPRPEYEFPYKNTGDNRFPHMQRPGEKPLFANAPAKWPVVVSSPGYNAHGLWELDRAKRLAAQGYIVVSIFHGDGRFNFFDLFRRRPVMVKQVLDRLLADPDFGPAIDAERIGISGSSFGAYTMLACLGASDPATGRAEFHDPRLKAGVGLVPFAGGYMKAPFGKDFSGLKTITRPYLALYAEKDESVAAKDVEAHTAQSSGPTTAVLLPGEGHLLSKAAWNDVPTWEILFFNAWLKDDAQARALLAGDLRVSGGVDERVTYRRDR